MNIYQKMANIDDIALRRVRDRRSGIIDPPISWLITRAGGVQISEIRRDYKPLRHYTEGMFLMTKDGTSVLSRRTGLPAKHKEIICVEAMFVDTPLPREYLHMDEDHLEGCDYTTHWGEDYHHIRLDEDPRNIPIQWDTFTAWDYLALLRDYLWIDPSHEDLLSTTTRDEAELMGYRKVFSGANEGHIYPAPTFSTNDQLWAVETLPDLALYIQNPCSEVKQLRTMYSL